MSATSKPIEVTDEFKNWARRYSGYEGGNPRARVWFCGIEPGGGNETPPMPVVETLPSRPVPWKSDFNGRLLKLYGAMMDGLPATRSVARKTGMEDPTVRSFCGKEGQVLKLNLFPIPFARESIVWEQKHFIRTGLPTKELYVAWCAAIRFEHFRQLLKENSPSIIVCFGKTYMHHFLSAFAPGALDFQGAEEEIVPNKRMTWLRLQNAKTVIAVLPFLSNRPTCLNDADLIPFAKRLRELMR